MITSVPQLRRLGGTERLHVNGTPLELPLLAFWQWMASDLPSNATRGRLAEYLVAQDLGVAEGVRREWLAHDLTTREGVKVEVKSAAYLQSWAQRRHSTISFDIRPTLGWDPDTAEFGDSPRRQSDVYVFSLLGEKDIERVDPMNVDQWRFLVLATADLDRDCPKQKTRLCSLGAVAYPIAVPALLSNGLERLTMSGQTAGGASA